MISGTEIGLGTICACMPAARAAFTRCLSRIKGSSPSQYYFSQHNMNQGSGRVGRQTGEEIDIGTVRSRRWSQLPCTESGDTDDENLVQGRGREHSAKSIGV